MSLTSEFTNETKPTFIYSGDTSLGAAVECCIRQV